MSDESKPTLQERVANALRLSAAAYVAICFGLTLLGLTLIAWITFNAEPQRVAWGDYLGWRQGIALGVSGCLSCALAYWTVRLWSEDVPAREADLEQAWQAGVAAIRKRSLDLSDLPIFLVLGCKEEALQARFLAQSGVRLVVPSAPILSTAPLRWYIAEDRIMLFCCDVGVYSATQSRLGLQIKDDSSDLAWSELESFSASTRALQAESALNSAADENENRTEQISAQSTDALYDSSSADSDHVVLHSANGTSQLVQQKSQLTSDTAAATRALESLCEAESLVSESIGSDLSEETSVRSCDSDLVRQAQHTAAILSSKEVIRYQSLLADTCRLLRVHRGSAAPINGVVAWVDGPQLMSNGRYSRQCGQALRNDCDQIQQQLGILAPVTVVLDRMQEVVGFSELIRRHGPDRAARNALGEAFDLQRITDVATVQELSRRSLRAVIHSVYKCFQASHQMGQPGSHKLFQLVIHCRGRLGQALSSLLIEAMGDASAPANLLSGVYFTASGEKPTQQGFGREVLARVMHQQGFLNWTRRRLATERRLRTVSLVMATATIALTMLAICQVVNSL